jgi:hypothetical protein
VKSIESGKLRKISFFACFSCTKTQALTPHLPELSSVPLPLFRQFHFPHARSKKPLISQMFLKFEHHQRCSIIIELETSYAR